MVHPLLPLFILYVFLRFLFFIKIIREENHKDKVKASNEVLSCTVYVDSNEEVKKIS